MMTLDNNIEKETLIRQRTMVRRDLSRTIIPHKKSCVLQRLEQYVSTQYLLRHKTSKGQ